jgi:hypothetical protein
MGIIMPRQGWGFAFLGVFPLAFGGLHFACLFCSVVWAGICSSD